MCKEAVIIPAAAPQPDPVAAGGQAGDKGQRRGVSRRVGGWQVGGRLLNAERPGPQQAQCRYLHPFHLGFAPHAGQQQALAVGQRAS